MVRRNNLVYTIQKLYPLPSLIKYNIKTNNILCNKPNLKKQDKIKQNTTEQNSSTTPRKLFNNTNEKKSSFKIQKKLFNNTNEIFFQYLIYTCTFNTKNIILTIQTKNYAKQMKKIVQYI